MQGVVISPAPTMGRVRRESRLASQKTTSHRVHQRHQRHQRSMEEEEAGGNRSGTRVEAEIETDPSWRDPDCNIVEAHQPIPAQHYNHSTTCGKPALSILTLAQALVQVLVLGVAVQSLCCGPLLAPVPVLAFQGVALLLATACFRVVVQQGAELRTSGTLPPRRRRVSGTCRLLGSATRITSPLSLPHDQTMTSVNGALGSPPFTSTSSRSTAATRFAYQSCPTCYVCSLVDVSGISSWGIH